jgi:hypothetical protein
MTAPPALFSLLNMTGQPPASYDEAETLRAAWRADLAANPNRAGLYAQTAYDAARLLIGKDDADPHPDPDLAALLVLYLVLACDNRIIPGFAVTRAFFAALQQNHLETLSLLKRACVLEDRPLCPPVHLVHGGNLGDAVNAILRHYRAHVIFGAPETPTLRADVQAFCPALLTRFPALRHPVALDLAEDHPDLVPAVATLIRARLQQPHDPEDDSAPLWDIGSGMSGYHTRRDNPLHARSAAIITATLRIAPPLDTAGLTSIRDGLLLGPLDLRPISQDAALTSASRVLAMWQRQIDADPTGGNSAYARKQLPKAGAALALIRTDFPAWQDRRLERAARHVAVTRATRRCLDTLAKALPPDLRAPLMELTDRADAITQRPRLYALPKTPDKTFRDIGLKLLVIEELMYRRSVLTPRFDIHAFAAEYTKRQISVEDDGYTPIPEALAYFKALPIPPALLEQVTSLHQSSGLDGGPAYMQHLHPFWDPGAGDVPVKVTAKAIDDLALLPALTRITGLENSAPGAKLRAALKARGIACLPEDAGQ